MMGLRKSNRFHRITLHFIPDGAMGCQALNQLRCIGAIAADAPQHVKTIPNVRIGSRTRLVVSLPFSIRASWWRSSIDAILATTNLACHCQAKIFELGVNPQQPTTPLIPRTTDQIHHVYCNSYP